MQAFQMDDTVGLVIVKSNYFLVILAFPGKTLVKTCRAIQFTRKTIVTSFLLPKGTGMTSVQRNLTITRPTESWIPAFAGMTGEQLLRM